MNPLRKAVAVLTALVALAAAALIVPVVGASSSQEAVDHCHTWDTNEGASASLCFTSSATPIPTPIPTPTPTPRVPVDETSFLFFDGVDDYVQIPNIEFGPDALTVSAWFSSPDFSNCGPSRDCRIIAKATGTQVQDHILMLSTVRDEDNQTRLRFRLRTDGITSTLIATAGELDTSTFAHVAATYDGTMMRLYLDGALVGEMPKTGLVDHDANVETWIGGTPPAPTLKPWYGGIDEVRIFNCAQSQEWIADNYEYEIDPDVACQ